MRGQARMRSVPDEVDTQWLLHNLFAQRATELFSFNILFEREHSLRYVSLTVALELERGRVVCV
jgi:hypothetical protein